MSRNWLGPILVWSVGLVVLVGIFLILSLRLNQKRIATPLGVLGTPVSVTVSSFLKAYSVSMLNSSDFNKQLSQIAPNVVKVQISFRSLIDGRAFYSFHDSSTSPPVNRLVLDPISFTDPVLGTYGFIFTYANQILSLDISLDDSKISQDQLNIIMSNLILGTAKYVNSLTQPIVLPSASDITGQIQALNEVNKLKLGPYQLFNLTSL